MPTAREIILPLSMMFTRSDKARITLLELFWPLLSNSLNHYHRCNGKQHTQRYHILLIISGEKLSCFFVDYFATTKGFWWYFYTWILWKLVKAGDRECFLGMKVKTWNNESFSLWIISNGIYKILDNNVVLPRYINIVIYIVTWSNIMIWYKQEL